MAPRREPEGSAAPTRREEEEAAPRRLNAALGAAPGPQGAGTSLGLSGRVGEGGEGGGEGAMAAGPAAAGTCAAAMRAAGRP